MIWAGNKNYRRKFHLQVHGQHTVLSWA